MWEVCCVGGGGLLCCVRKDVVLRDKYIVCSNEGVLCLTWEVY